MIGEVSGGETTTYLRGINIICTDEYYYVFDAHGDVVNLTDADGSVVKSYDYDAFGVEKNIDEADSNPFRYCGEYWDSETETYYLRARYYDPNLGRFTSEDTYWNVSNMIYGDNPQKINEREDKLGLKTYSYVPQSLVMAQSGNLYVYCANEPVNNVDITGQFLISTAVLIGIGIGALIGGIAGGAYGYNKAVKNDIPEEERWKYVVGYGVGGAVIGGVIGGFVGYGIGFLFGEASTGSATLKAISKALSSIAEKRWGHIITDEHAWSRVLEKVTKKGVEKIISKALQEGVSTFIKEQVKNGVTSVVYQLVYSYMGEEIIVQYSIVDGILSIANAWVKTR